MHWLQTFVVVLQSMQFMTPQLATQEVLETRVKLVLQVAQTLAEEQEAQLVMLQFRRQRLLLSRVKSVAQAWQVRLVVTLLQVMQFSTPQRKQSPLTEPKLVTQLAQKLLAEQLRQLVPLVSQRTQREESLDGTRAMAEVLQVTQILAELQLMQLAMLQAVQRLSVVLRVKLALQARHELALLTVSQRSQFATDPLQGKAQVLSDWRTKVAGQARQVSLALQAVQLAVVQTAQGKNPSEMLLLVHWEQVKLSSPKLVSQLVQRKSSWLQVLQRVVLQSLQRKVVWLVNWDEAQATHDPLLLSPKPSAHSVQRPSVALQAWQPVQGAQVPVPLALKVLAAHAEQMVPSGKKPELQVRQFPLD